jgi:hypothetical protein
MTMAIKSSEVVFFLGAGASVKAGVPATYSFVEEYVKSIEEPAKKDTIIKIVNTLERWKKGEIDVELLLETLTKLKDKDHEPLLPFYPGGTYILEEHHEIEPLIDDLKNFIKSKGLVSEEKIEYLKPLCESIEKSKPLDVISVNYDTCIEQFCEKYNLIHQDGFDDKWNPRIFEEANTDIRLYKLHGSVTWYQSKNRDYKKLTVFTENTEITLSGGKKAENLMLYPMQELDYVGPLLELLVEIKHLLESESCKLLVVVGYSFRDGHITEILWDAAKINKNLHLILIDPKAYEIYNEQLKYFRKDDNTNKSSLNERVICLPYLFEEVLPYLKHHYIKELSEGLRCEMGREEEVRKRQKADWISCIKHFIDAEFIEKIESILLKTGFEPDSDLKLGLELPLKMAVNLFAGGQEEKAVKYFRDFQNQLNKVAVKLINANILPAHSHSSRILGSPHDSQIEFQFNYIRHDSSTSYHTVEQFKQIIIPLAEFCETRAGFVSESENKLQKISEKLRKVKYYFESFKEDKIKFEDYIKLRESKIPNLELFRNEYKTLQEAGLTLEQQQRLEANIVEIERSILKEIIEEE